MRSLHKLEMILCLMFFSISNLLTAQPQVTVNLIESTGGCQLQTNCDIGRICVDIVMSVNQNKNLNSYNIWVEYDGDVISREAFGVNNNQPIGDNTCVILNGNQDTDLEDPGNIPDHWRVAAVLGNFPMTANVPVTVHTICFIILQPSLLDGQQVCVGGFVGGPPPLPSLQSTVTFTDDSFDDNIPETCMIIDENFISCSLLPIKLLDFEVTKKDRTAVLDWTTSYESNLNYFEVQKAGEDKRFTPVGKVSGAGNSTSIQSYRFVDSSPFSGNNFYRLRSVDYDGKEDYSPIRSVQFDARVPRFSIHPNPTADNISIVSDDLNGGPYEIMIYSLDGLPLYTSRVDNLNEDNLISLDDLKPGIYQVSVRGKGYEWHEKLVKVE